MRDPFVPVSIVLGAAMISVSIVWSASLSPRIAPPAEPSARPVVTDDANAPVDPPVDATKLNLDGEPFVGTPEAKAVMAFWYDYQCPYCRQLEETVLPQLMTDYVDTGKLRIYFKDYAFLGPDSQTAALTSRAVWDTAPSAFYAWHSAVYAHQDGENRGWGNAADLNEVTRSLPAIDGDAVVAALGAKQAIYQKAIEADFSEGQAFGIQGTPGAIIGDQLISGAQPYAVFKAAIERAIAASSTP